MYTWQISASTESASAGGPPLQSNSLPSTAAIMFDKKKKRLLNKVKLFAATFAVNFVLVLPIQLMWALGLIASMDYPYAEVIIIGG